MKSKKYFFKSAIIIVSIFFLSACATKMTPDRVSQIKGRSIAIATFEPSSLRAMTGTKAGLLGPLFGDMAAATSGSNIMKENNVPDPAIKLVENLGSVLAEKYNLTLLNKEPYLNISKTDYKATSTKAGGADLLLVLQTAYMKSMYQLTTINNYTMDIATDASLIDAASGETLISGSCWYKARYDHGEDAPTWEYLYENGAVGLKEHIKNAEEYCVKQFMIDVFNQ